MVDKLGNPVHQGDIVLFPGGNARYGGIKIMVGKVVSATPKMVTLLYGDIGGDKKLKTCRKRPAGLLVIQDPRILKCERIQQIHQEST